MSVCAQIGFWLLMAFTVVSSGVCVYLLLCVLAEYQRLILRRRRLEGR